MIKSVFNYPVSTLLDIESNLVYSIPRYQREYTWGKTQWEALFDDLIENEANYFLGSIICINQADDALAVQELELVDGQQRMTTLSLLLIAIYQTLKSVPDKDLDLQLELRNLKHRLVLKKKPDQPRLILQVQNNNQQDYFDVLHQIELLEDTEPVYNAGNRRITKAYRHFLQCIENHLYGENIHHEIESAQVQKKLLALLEKVNSATLVKIEVSSHSDAYTLFESLNNRGIPLTAIDLIKNKLLAKLEEKEPGSIDKHYNNWKKVIEALGDDYAIQERFFRQYYNGFKSELKDVVSVPVATKSNLMQVYEKLVNHNPLNFLNTMKRLSGHYANLMCFKPMPDHPQLSNALLALDRIQGAAAYLLLMVLFDKQETLKLNIEQLTTLTQFLVSFFVRRNTTDLPPTRDLTRIFMEITESILSLQGDEILTHIIQTLTNCSASNDVFRRDLQGSLYEENKGVCRFVLCALAEEQMTRENEVDLWRLDGKQFVWTIEHILPQGENIPQTWIDMIANGDAELAKEHRIKYAHRLGNLTISGYNSSLGNKSLSEKQSRTDSKGRKVGYNNGLSLNQKLATEESWTVEKIQTRTVELVDRILEKYQLKASL